MPGVDLFLSLAEIAGVFVGFAALIAARSRGTMAVGEAYDLRWVVTTGIWVVISALLPTILGSYGLGDHALWLVCSLVAFALLAVMVVVFGRTPETKAERDQVLGTTPMSVIALWMGTTFWLPALSLVLALAFVVLGLFPDQERALYLTAVALGLIMGALGLFAEVFWQARPPSARQDAGAAPGR